MNSSWTQAINEYRQFLIARGLASSTIRLRTLALRRIGEQLGGPPSSITPESIIAILGTPGWSREYRKSVRATLIGFVQWAKLCDTSEAPPVQSSRPHPKPLPERLWRSVLTSTADDSRLNLMIRLAGEAGLRRAEVAGLHSEHLTDAAGPALLVRGKGDKQRVVPINDDLAARIESLPSGWLFPHGDGGHLTPGHVGKLVADALPDGYSMHSLRHRFASKGYASTRNLRAVQEVLGHASVATTQIYTAVSNDDVRAVSMAAAG